MAALAAAVIERLVKKTTVAAAAVALEVVLGQIVAPLALPAVVVVVVVPAASVAVAAVVVAAAVAGVVVVVAVVAAAARGGGGERKQTGGFSRLRLSPCPKRDGARAGDIHVAAKQNVLRDNPAYPGAQRSPALDDAAVLFSYFLTLHRFNVCSHIQMLNFATFIAATSDVERETYRGRTTSSKLTPVQVVAPSDAHSQLPDKVSLNRRHGGMSENSEA